MPTKSTDEVTLVLVAQYQEHQSPDAANELFRRYSERLLRFLRPRLSARLARRVEPDDIVQSLFNSFFRGVRDGGFVFEQREDVWRLLVRIALHKLNNQCRRHQTGKRDVGRETGELLSEAVSREPSPDEAVAVGDELEQLLHRRSPRDREILEQYISGAPYETIAHGVNWSQRTVRRVCEQFLTELQQRLAVESEPINDLGGAGS